MSELPIEEVYKDGILSMLLSRDANDRGNGIENLTCMAYSGTSHSEVLAAGGQNQVLILNVDRGSIVKQVMSFDRRLTVGIDFGMVY